MATFKCIRSGNIVSFENENDIAGLRKHEGYIEVKDETTSEEKAIETIKKEETRPVLKLKRGRPKK